MAGIKLAEGASNGAQTSVAQARFAHLTESHLRTLFVDGTFNNANVAFEISHDDSVWFPVANASTITVKTVLNVEFRAPFVRVNITGGGGSESINATLL